MTVRKAVTSDEKQLAALLIKFDRDTQAALSPAQAKYRAYSDPIKTLGELAERYVSNPENIVFVAEEAASIRGFICGQVIEKSGRTYSREGYVDNWYVESAFQNQKVGKRLFDALTAEFARSGCTHIGVDTHLENESAINIYEHMGFAKRLVTFYKII